MIPFLLKILLFIGTSWSWSYGRYIYNYLCNSAYHH